MKKQLFLILLCVPCLVIAKDLDSVSNQEREATLTTEQLMNATESTEVINNNDEDLEALGSSLEDGESNEDGVISFEESDFDSFGELSDEESFNGNEEEMVEFEEDEPPVQVTAPLGEVESCFEGTPASEVNAGAIEQQEAGSQAVAPNPNVEVVANQDVAVNLENLNKLFDLLRTSDLSSKDRAFTNTFDYCVCQSIALGVSTLLGVSAWKLRTNHFKTAVLSGLLCTAGVGCSVFSYRSMQKYQNSVKLVYKALQAIDKRVLQKLEADYPELGGLLLQGRDQSLTEFYTIAELIQDAFMAVHI